jgi:hypothetical protein
MRGVGFVCLPLLALLAPASATEDGCEKFASRRSGRNVEPLHKSIREQRGLTRFAGPEAFAMPLRLPTTTNEAKTVPCRGHTSTQWDRARLAVDAR